MAEARKKWADFKLQGVLGGIRCPYLIVHAAHDVLGVRQATHVYEHAKQSGVDVRIKLFEADETGAEHCQHDNPTLGAEYMADWVAERFGIKQSNLLRD
jgi:hypothetical protein